MLLENVPYSHTQTSRFCICITRTVTIKSFMLHAWWVAFKVQNIL